MTAKRLPRPPIHGSHLHEYPPARNLQSAARTFSIQLKKAGLQSRYANNAG